MYSRIDIYDGELNKKILEYDEEDKKIKENEIIVLTHLKNIEYSNYNEFLSTWKRYNLKKIEKNKPKEEIKKEVEKEILEEVEKIKAKSLKTHYKIDNQKVIELEKTFKSSKLKVYLHNPIILKNGIICSYYKREITIYENKYFNILFNFTVEDVIKSVTQLDNNDLIFAGENNNTLYIYRLKDNKFSLFQKIKEDNKGYKKKKMYLGSMICTLYFELEGITKLSNNKFMTISNYGLKIYSLNSSNKYSLILVDTHSYWPSKIYEINGNNFIFCKNYKCLLEKIELKEIKVNEIKEKLDNLKKKENYYYNDSITNIKEKEEINEFKKDIKSIKFTTFSTIIFESTCYKKFSDYVILKKKYFLIMADYQILIFDILNGEKVKEYIILEEEKNLYKYSDYEIKKWNNINDNEFILIKKGNIFLFELNENSQNNIELTIIAYSYFPQVNFITKMNEENSFFIDKEDYILILKFHF